MKYTSVPFFRDVREWRIRRPPIYRYLRRAHAAQFFDDGTLRLSSFDLFAKHPDEQRNDPDEGRGTTWLTNAVNSSGLVTGVGVRHGRDAYVLCGSTRLSLDIAREFGTDSGFRIDDSLRFSEAISRCIPGFSGGQEGPCTYVQVRGSKKPMQSHHMARAVGILTEPSEDSDAVFEAIDTLTRQASEEDYLYMKDLRYALQSEYRLLWFAQPGIEESLTVKCPDARQFCTPFEELFSEAKHQIESPNT